MNTSRGIDWWGVPLFAIAALAMTGCTVQLAAKRDDLHVMEVSVPQQKMAVYRKGALLRTYPISTSRFGLGNEKGSYRTPLGKMEVAAKIGDGKPPGAVFKHRKWTGEVIEPDSPGRDPSVSRILWLNGLERRNANTYSRYIYIHGTAAERDIGKPASYGCIRMKSRDVIDLFAQVGEGAKVFVVRKNLWRDEESSGKELEAIRALPLPAGPNAPALPRPVPPPAVRPVPNPLAQAPSGAGQLATASAGNGVSPARSRASDLALD